MLKLSENPPILSPAVESLSELEGDWWVAHTKSRFEKALAWDLLQAGVDYFLPMVERVIVSSGKKRCGMVPLFPSYVFFCGSAEHRLKVLATQRVCQVIPVKARRAFVSEISALEQAITSGFRLDLFPELVIGRRCRVRRGSLMGVEGTLVAKDDVSRIVLQVSLLGQGASLEIPADDLELID